MEGAVELVRLRHNRVVLCQQQVAAIVAGYSAEEGVASLAAVLEYVGKQCAGCGLAVAAANCKAGFSLCDVAESPAPLYYLVALGIDGHELLHVRRYRRRVDYQGVLLVLRNQGRIVLVMDGDAFALQGLGQRARGAVISAHVAAAALVISCQGAHSDSADSNEVNVLWLGGCEVFALAEFQALVSNLLSGIRLCKQKDVLLQIAPLFLIGDQSVYCVHQLAFRLGVLYYHCGVLVYQRHGVVCLMVFRNVRARHEHGAFARYAEFGYRSGSGTADHDVGSGVGKVHPANEISTTDTLMRGRFQKLVYLLLVDLATLPDNLESLYAVLQYSFFHTVVQGTASQASTHNEYGFLLGIKVVEADSLFLHLRGAADNLLADRVSCKKDPVLREEAFHIVVSYAYLGCLGGVLAVYDSGKGVLLLQKYRNLQGCGSANHCCGGISADSYNEVRLEFLHDFLCQAAAFEVVSGYAYVGQGVERPVESSCRDSLDRVACGRNLFHFHSAAGSHK